MYKEISINSFGLQTGSKAYKKGVCQIIVSPPSGNYGWHMSISCPFRDPIWQEIRDAWYNLIPDAKNMNGAMFFPPTYEYVNIHKYCFHIHEVSKEFKEMKIDL